MQIHELKPVHRLKRKKRVGRGGKRGTYSGRGIKGQKARAGHKIKPMERELVMRIPKLRGVKFKSRILKPAVVNVETVDKLFSAGERVSPKALVGKGLVRKMKGRVPIVKLLGAGRVTKALLIEGCYVSEPAKVKILAAGGQIKE
ncbi:MAG: uL15 family ribosomal protein [Parcubacteria group bacterium]|nr:uL15 family ribosomal protein [Parcubacteria group bacterium]